MVSVGAPLQAASEWGLGWRRARSGKRIDGVEGRAIRLLDDAEFLKPALLLLIVTERRQNFSVVFADFRRLAGYSGPLPIGAELNG